jgi:hypothetical protein
MLFPQSQASPPLGEECHAYRDHGDRQRADGSGGTCPVRARSDRNESGHGGSLRRATRGWARPGYNVPGLSSALADGWAVIAGPWTRQTWIASRVAVAMALFADDDYEEVAARLAGTLAAWECWDDSWNVPTSGGITQARQRLRHEPLRELFSQVAVPVAGT